MIPPGPGFVGLLRERARRSPARGFQRFGPPLGAAPKPAAPLGVSHGEARKPTALPGLLHGEVRKPTALPGLLRGEAEKPTAPPGVCHGEARKPTTPPGLLRGEAERRPRRPDFFTAKRESRQRRSPLPGRGFFGRAAGRNGALPYNARKSQFLRNGDVWATESLFLFAVLWLAFLPDQSETGVAGGGKARRPKTPAAPRRPAQRPRPAPGFCAASANARPGDPAPVRLLEKALWVPPTTEPFRPAPSGKPERERKRKGGSPMPRPPPVRPRPVSHDRSA